MPHYGGTVRKGTAAITFIEKNGIEQIVTYDLGGILRFRSQVQAEKFLENNRELVESYIQTF